MIISERNQEENTAGEGYQWANSIVYVVRGTYAKRNSFCETQISWVWREGISSLGELKSTQVYPMGEGRKGIFATKLPLIQRGITTTVDGATRNELTRCELG